VDKPTSSLPYFASRPRFLSRMKGAPWYHRYRRVSATRLRYPPRRSASFVVSMSTNPRFCMWCGKDGDGHKFVSICADCFIAHLGISTPTAASRRDLYNILPDRSVSAHPWITRLFYRGSRRRRNIVRRTYRVWSVRLWCKRRPIPDYRRYHRTNQLRIIRRRFLRIMGLKGKAGTRRAWMLPDIFGEGWCK
jgi:hypothetical protein